MDHTSVQNGFVSLYYYFILWAFSWACLEWQMGWVYTSGTIPLAQLCQASSIKISQRVWKKTNAVWTQQFLRCMEVNREQGWCHDASLSASVPGTVTTGTARCLVNYSTVSENITNPDAETCFHSNTSIYHSNRRGCVLMALISPFCVYDFLSVIRLVTEPSKLLSSQWRHPF